jgi:hypothetical protein
MAAGPRDMAPSTAAMDPDRRERRMDEGFIGVIIRFFKAVRGWKDDTEWLEQ